MTLATIYNLEWLYYLVTRQHCVMSRSEWVRTSENEAGVSRDLASAYVLCLRTFVVPNLWRDEGKSLGKKEQIGRLRELTRMNEVDF